MAWPAAVSSTTTPSRSGGPRTTTPTVFEQQREEFVREIAVGMEQVLQNINRLNRNLESIIAVGNEFSSVEALWSQFENFMGRTEEETDHQQLQSQAESQSRQKDDGDDHGEDDHGGNDDEGGRRVE